MDLDLTGAPKDDPLPGYAQRLRSTRRLCSVLAGTAALLTVLSGVLVSRAGVPGLPPAAPVTLSLLAAILILLSSRLRSTTLKRAFPRTPAMPVNPEAVLAAYQKATLVSFLILEAACLLGLVVALLSGSALYGIVLCAVSLLGMLTRWPRATEVDHLVRGRAKP